MISKDTAAEIWHCYREIAAAEKLLHDIAKERQAAEGRGESLAPTIRDAYGRRQDLQLGIPSGYDAHTLVRVSPLLAESVIRAHIADKRAALTAANEKARHELDHADFMGTTKEPTT